MKDFLLSPFQINQRSMLMDGLKKRHISCCLFSEGNILDAQKIERSIATSRTTLVILSEHCLNRREVQFAFSAAGKHYIEKSRVILVKQTCFNQLSFTMLLPFLFFRLRLLLFTSSSVRRQSPFFPVRVYIIIDLLGYMEEGIQQIITKFTEEKKALENANSNQVGMHEEDICTRVFLR